MKGKVFFILLLFIALIGCDMSNSGNHNIPKSEQAVNNSLEEITNVLRKKYKMRPIGTNVAMPEGNVKLLGLDFHIPGPLSRNEIRKILIGSAHDFLEIVNLDSDLRPYLNNYPFKIENIEITLFM